MICFFHLASSPGCTGCTKIKEPNLSNKLFLRLNSAIFAEFQDGDSGFEPELLDSESSVLPLDESPAWLFFTRNYTSFYPREASIYPYRLPTFVTIGSRAQAAYLIHRLTMDAEKIETFLCAADNLSFSEAAKLLHLSQPSVSHQIKTLEHELGVGLFTRSNTGLELTEAGRVLLPWARRVIQDMGSMKEMVCSLDEDIVGELRISCSTTSGKYLLPQFVARFCRRHPKIRASILTCRPERATLDLMKGDAHIGVVSTEITDPNLEAQHFFTDNIAFIVPASHRWATRCSIEAQELLY